MGRRALRKVDPSLDLSRHFFPLEDFSPDELPHRHFQNQQPLEVEIGVGKGLFIEAASKNRPTHNFLGIEISPKYARFAASKLAGESRENAIVLHGDGRRLLAEILPPQSLAAIHVYFPDPWWKKRHHKRRLLDGQFADSIVRSLCAGGEFHFWTDVQAYFDASAKVLASAESLEGPHAVAERDAEHDFDYQTHFERRVRMNNLPVYRAWYRKSE